MSGAGSIIPLFMVLLYAIRRTIITVLFTIAVRQNGKVILAGFRYSYSLHILSSYIYARRTTVAAPPFVVVGGTWRRYPAFRHFHVLLP